MTALRKVLVVDDDPVVGASFNRVLSGKGYIVVSAENGYDALAKLQAEKFDAVFTDLRMPGMDGVQVAENVRAAQPWTPVVIVTGYGSPASEARARAAGVTEFLHKPLSPEMIEDSAAKAVMTVPAAIAEPVVAAAVAAAPEVAPAAEAATGSRIALTLKNMGLFLIAPFIGLAYAVLLPFVGFGMLLWVATEGWRKGKADKPAAAAARPELVVVAAPAAEIAAAPAAPARKHGALEAGKVALGLVAAPFIGLAYVVVLPFAGIAALAWFAGKAAFGRTAE